MSHSTRLGRTVPREDGENEEGQDGTSESSGGGGLDVFSALLSALFSALFLADSGERRKPRRTGHSGVRGGQDKGFVLKLSWPSTAEYRMMKLKKKTATRRPRPYQKRAGSPGDFTTLCIRQSVMYLTRDHV